MARTRNPYLRVAIVWIAMLGIWLVLGQVRRAMFGEGYTLGGHVLSAILATLLAVPATVAARRWLDGGTLAGLGLVLSPAALRHFAAGALSFLLPSALGFAIVLGFGWATITPTAPGGEILLFVPQLVMLVILYEALPEELVFRGYIYRALAERRARIVAVVVQALLFGVWGAALWTITTGAPALERLGLFTAVGFVLGLIRAAAGSVWATIGVHAAFQTVAQLLLNVERGHFAIEGVEPMQLIALGIVPFALATTIVGFVYGEAPPLREPEGGEIR